jgi:hypothetical protein
VTKLTNQLFPLAMVVQALGVRDGSGTSGSCASSEAIAGASSACDVRALGTGRSYHMRFIPIVACDIRTRWLSLLIPIYLVA